MHDVSFSCMGCEMRLLADVPVDAARELLHSIDARLSRFRAGSELARLNADPRAVVPASPLLRAAIGAALWAAERSGGLVVPTLLDDLERLGYPDRRGERELSPASGGSGHAQRAVGRWEEVVVDDRAATIARPPGLRLDTGGTTKGLAADLAARLLEQAGAKVYAVDCAGDLRVRGLATNVEHPRSGGVALTLPPRIGGIATSGPGRRNWARADGTRAHHLIDPRTREPADTGLLSTTALAPTTLEAEVLAKHAFLEGPSTARRVLRAHGGVLVHEDGTVEPVGQAARTPIRLRLAA